MKSSRAVPIAIIGMACRFPGQALNPQSFWEMITNGTDCITPIPSNRWNRQLLENLNETPETDFARVGGFVDQIENFDAKFFGISPREAVDIDPQQRMLLELAWQCMEDAAVAPSVLERLRTGVFVGVINHDYERLILADRSEIGAHSGLGRSTSIAANRISYCFNLSGPSVTIDTACSSSLTAIDAACNALASGTADVAFAGGANAILAPESYIEFSRAAMLSKSGHCRMFDDNADGFVRAEGGGLILLKRLADALTDNDRIYATIIATSVNQDGRTAGIMAPSLQAQQEMMHDALAKSGIRRSEIGYVEAHGTGTRVGDSIEAESLGTAYGHPDLLVGSVKTNIGHTESAAGIAGLIKAALAVFHAKIPPNLHFTNPNSNIDFDSLGLRVPVETMSWDRPANSPRIAAVNSFGFGGANAHAIIQQAPAHFSRRVKRSDTSLLVPISARNPETLEDLSLELRRKVDSNAVSATDLGFTASRMPQHRLRSALKFTPDGESGTVHERRKTHAPASERREVDPAVAFVFNGIGVRWNGEGAELFATQPVFRATVELCDTLFDRSLGVRRTFESGSQFEPNELVKAHAIHFTLQIALSELWKSWGVNPSAVIGHSMGEVAAACAAGCISLPEAIDLVSRRASGIEPFCGSGLMLAASLNVEEANKIIAGSAEPLFIAAVNSPESITFAGSTQSIQTLAKTLDAEGRFNRTLEVPVPFHSPIIESAQTDISDRTSVSALKQPEAAWFSSVIGSKIHDEFEESNFWWRNFLEPVQFESALNASIRSGCDLFVEIGPHANLNFNIHECLKASGADNDTGVVYSIHRDHSEQYTMQSAAAALYCQGVNIRFDRINPAANVCDFPTAKLEGEAHWKPKPEFQQIEKHHIEPHCPLIEEHTNGQTRHWNIPLKTKEWPWLNRHRLRGELIFPAAGYVEAALETAGRTYGSQSIELRSLRFPNLLLIQANADIELTLRSQGDSLAHEFEISSLNESVDSKEITHSRGQFSEGENCRPALQIEDINRKLQTKVSPETIEQRFEDWEFSGDSDHWLISEIRAAGQDELAASIKKIKAVEDPGQTWLLDPSLLDLCFRCAVGIAESADLLVPFEIESLKYWRDVPDEVCCYIRKKQTESGLLEFDMTLAGANGGVIAAVSNLRLRELTGIQETQSASADSLFALERKWKIHQPGRGIESRFECDLSVLQRKLQEHTAAAIFFRCRWNHYGTANPALAEIAVAYIGHALNQLGILLHKEKLPIGEVAAKFNIAKDQQALFSSLLRLLSDCGYLTISQNNTPEIEFSEDWKPDPAHSVERFLAMPESVEYLAELMLIDRCGAELPNVLIGQKSGIEVLFPDGSADLLQHLYQSSPTCQIYNDILGQSVSELLDTWALTRPCRILEVGAGTGAVLSHLAPVLKEHSIEYTFSDVSSLFVRRAKRRFKNLKFVQFTELDLNADFEIQGLDNETFDIILAADALHLVDDPGQTLQRLGKLLGSGGFISFIELTDEPAWARLVFGMLRDWWPRDESDRSSEPPCLSRESWLQLLKDADYEHVDALTDREDENDGVHSVFVARKPLSLHLKEEPEVAVTRKRLVFSNSDSFSDSFVNRFDKDSTMHVTVGSEFSCCEREFVADPDNPDHLKQLIGRLKQNSEMPDEIIFLWNFTNSHQSETAAGPLLGKTPVLAVAMLIQAFDHHSVYPSSLSLVTANAQSVKNELSWQSCVNAGLWGFGRSLRNEYPNINVRLVDIDPSGDSKGQNLHNLLVSKSNLSEVCLRHADHYVPVLREMNTDRLSVTQPQYTVLAQSGNGNLDSLNYEIKPLPPLKDTEVLIEVCAASLNFRDVMIALDALPDSSVTGGVMQHSLGIECAGYILAIGEHVRSVAVGEPVVALATNSLASHAVADQAFVCALPEGGMMEQYAGVPTAYVTGLFCFPEIIKLKKSDRVLIHCASGGVGIALINLVRKAGATVLASAGTPDKVHFLNLIGVDRVADSRSSSFVSDVLEWTDGEGADVIVNVLGGELAAENKHILSKGGTFIELGKYESREAVHKQIRQSNSTARIEVVDIDSTWLKHPEVVQRLFQEVIHRVNQNDLPLLPCREFPVSNANEAFRLMAGARHIGKIILAPDPDSSCDTGVWRCGPIWPHVTYLITGGTRGFGLATALWLAEQGAKHIVVVGRSAEISEELKSAIRTAESFGCTIAPVSADITNPVQLRSELEKACQTLPRIRGVIHCAMEIDDSAIINLNPERIQKSINAKVTGAWNLHQLTQYIDLEFFILYSSVTSVLGPAGQAAYAAANSTIDAFADYLRQAGVPATSINWGAVSDAGHVADNPSSSTAVGNQFGIVPLPADRLLATLNGLIKGSHASQIIVSGAEWQEAIHVRERAESGDRSSTITQSRVENEATDSNGFADSVLDCISRVLEIPKQEIELDEPIVNLGIDSLLAVELSHLLRSNCQVEVSASSLLDQVSVRDIVGNGLMNSRSTVE